MLPETNHEAVTASTIAATTPDPDYARFIRDSFPNDGHPVTVRPVRPGYYRVNLYRPDYRIDSLVRVYEIARSRMIEVVSTPGGLTIIDHTERG